MSVAGARNAYYCPECRGLTLTIHIDEGVTPMFLACRREGLEPEDNPCKGMGHSLMYPPAQGFFNFLDLAHEPMGSAPPLGPGKAVDWEWYAANEVQRRGELPLSLRRREPLLVPPPKPEGPQREGA